jgi:uncharacterized repeat protein (TIGR01451 family)
MRGKGPFDRLRLKRSPRLPIVLSTLILALPFAQRAGANIQSVTKTVEPGGAITAGATAVYTIEVVIAAGTSSTDLIITDSLPTDAGGNLVVEVVDSSCEVELNGGFYPFTPACLTEGGFLTDQGELRFEFIGTMIDDGDGDLTARAFVTVRVNESLNDEFILRNRVSVNDAENNGGAGAVGTTVDSEVQSALLSLTKSASPSGPVPPGDRITYTLEIANGATTAADPAHGVVIQDVLPPNVSFVLGSSSPAGFPDNCTVCGACTDGFGGPCPQNGGVVTWQYDVLHDGDSRILTFDVIVNEDLQPGDLIFNVATAFDAQGHLVTDSHLQIATKPCLTMEKTVASCSHPQECNGTQSCARPDAPGPLDIVTYEIEVSNDLNPGCATARGVEVTDSVPAGMSFFDCGGASCFANGDEVLWIVGDVAPGSPVTLTLRLRVDEGIADGTVIENVAMAESQDGSRASASAEVTVRPPVLNLSKSGTPNPIEPGGILTYEIRISNTGENCSPGIDLLDVMPKNALLQIGSITSSPQEGAPEFEFCDVGDDDNGGVLFIDTDPITNEGTQFLIRNFDLDAGEFCTVQFRMSLPEGTALRTNVTNRVTATDEQGNSAEATEVIPVNSRLIGLSKVVSGCTFPPGGPTCSLTNPPAGAELTYTVTATTGPFVSANTRVFDTLPDLGANGVASLPLVRSLTDCENFELNGNVLTCFIGDIPPNSSATFRVTILLNDDNPEGTLIVNRVEARNDALDLLFNSVSVVDAVAVIVGPRASDDGEPDPGGEPEPAPRLQLVVTAPPVISLGRRMDYEVVVTNAGDEAARGVTLSNTVPSGTKIVRLGPRESCQRSQDRSSFVCELGDMGPGQSTTVQARVSVRRRFGANAGDQLKNRVNANCSNCDSASGTSVTQVVSRRAR